MNEETSPRSRALAQRHLLRPSEQRVADLILERPTLITESTADELAQHIGIARTSVIRAAQTLGYRGYAHLRVAVTRNLDPVASDQEDHSDGVLGSLQQEVRRVAARLPETLDLLNEDELEEAIERVLSARRIVLAANGLSAPLGHDLLMRLNAMGVRAEYAVDAMTQQVLAGSLTHEDLLLVISGSGVNELTLRSVRAALEEGAPIIAVTSFAGTPLTAAATLSLTVASTSDSFRDELERTSRIAHAVFLDAFMKQLEGRMGERVRRARDHSLNLIAENLIDSDR